MVTEQDVHFTAGCPGFLLQTHEQVVYLSGFRASICDIADAYDMSSAAGPAEVLVEYTGILEQIDKRVICAVHVTERDDPFDAAPAIGLLCIC